MNRTSIYQEIIREHNQNPQNYYKMKNANIYLKGSNPLCGDNLEIFCIKKNDIIQEISFHGHGCAISKASASIMTTVIKRCTSGNALKIFKVFHRFMTGSGNEIYKIKHLKDLLVFKSIIKVPTRVKCAMLAWYTLKSVIEY